jgi:predicted MFS family arabinose efflux permease
MEHGGMMSAYERIARLARRNLRGLWRLRDFRRLWLSLTVTSFGAQITNLALPLTAALLLQATPLQMGILVALETLPFALVSLHAGVLLDRGRKLPIVITSDVSRGLALLSIPLCAWQGVLSIEVLYAVGFFCGVQNVVGGAAYQVLIAQMAGRDRLVEANAKITLGETSAALVGPGIAAALIHALTAPFAIVLDAASFIASALMLRRVQAPNDVPAAATRQSMGADIREGLALVWNNPTLRSLALVAAAWQVLHHMQVAVLILFATRDLGLSAGALGVAYMAGGLGCVLAATFAERLARRVGVGPLIVYGLLLTAFGWQVFGLIRGSTAVATVALGTGMLLFDFGAVLWGINYLSLRQAITPDRLLGRMTATMRFLAVAVAPLGSLAGGVLATGIGLRPTLWVVGALGIVLAVVAMRWSPVRRHRHLPAVAIE